MVSHELFAKALAVLLLLASSLAPQLLHADNSVAFFYGANPPVNVLSQFDRLILESDNTTEEQLSELKRNGSAAFAYLSIGEVGPDRGWSASLDPEWALGINDTWNSRVLDLNNPGWQRFLLQRVDHLVSLGYDGLFLDTMDSYNLYVKNESDRTNQETGLVNLIYRMKRRHPSLRLITNRGFEVVDRIAGFIEAVAAESLYASWNNTEQAYTDVPEADRDWLLGKLSAIKQQHSLDIISIDYLPPSRRSDARNVALKIAQHGFIPWVSNPSLDYVGVGNLEVLPREVLLLFNGAESPIQKQPVHTLIATPLEYLGYVPVYLDISSEPLPQGVLKGHYAGIVAWGSFPESMTNTDEWLKKQFEQTVPVAMFSEPLVKLDSQTLALLGLQTVQQFETTEVSITKQDAMTGYESPVPPRIEGLPAALVSVSNRNSRHLTITDNKNNSADAVITGPWGGIALHPYVIDLRADEIPYWILDPFTFLKTALQLTDAPMPDVTTENGNRLWLAHIDGDALPSWAELAGRRLGAEVIQDEILKPYDLPHTISIVEAEMTATPDYADRQERMVSVMREIFAHDNVEIASHTYSHPFDWIDIKHADPSGRYNLPIDGYRFDLEREIVGSVRYIDQMLAPPGKRTRVFLWSGNALPGKEALDIVEREGLLNMNGGLTIITNASNSLSRVTPMVRMVEGRTQVYAPIMNENVYTNDWTGPFDGFRRAIENFQLTNYPRRLKPLNVYYHFYAGTKKASLRSLREIYDYSKQQEIMPVFSSYYIEKVPYFRTAGVARHLDGRWKVTGLGSIKSLRMLNQNSWPDLASSSALIGSRTLHDGTYIHTDGSNKFSFRLQSGKPRVPHLVAANAQVTRWQKHRNSRIELRLKGTVPVIMELAGDMRYCQIRDNNGKFFSGTRTPAGNTRFEFQSKDTGDAVLDCQT